MSVILMSVLLMPLAACGNSGKLRLGAAQKDGNYYDTSQKFAKYVRTGQSGAVITVKETAGSAANLRLLTGKYIELALAQADVIRDHYTEFSLAEGESPGYSAIAALYPEVCQIVAAADSGIQTIEDLEGKTVSIGEAESGTEHIALKILNVYRLEENALEITRMNTPDAAKALQEGKIDAFFYTAGLQTPEIEELARQTEIRFLAVEGKAAKAMLKKNAEYFPYTIPAGMYTGLSEDVQTVGVRSVLLVRDDVPADTVRALTADFYAFVDTMELSVSGEDIGAASAAVLQNLPISLHPGAQAYYAEHGITAGAEQGGEQG